MDKCDLLYDSYGQAISVPYLKADISHSKYPVDSHKTLTPIRDEGGWKGTGLGFQLGTACRDSGV